jgi:hypothetical protein
MPKDNFIDVLRKILERDDLTPDDRKYYFNEWSKAESDRRAIAAAKVNLQLKKPKLKKVRLPPLGQEHKDEVPIGQQVSKFLETLKDGHENPEETPS